MRIRNYEALTNHGNTEGRKIVADIMEAALSAADPYENTLELVRLEGGKLIFEGTDFEPKGDPKSGPAVYDLDSIDRVYVFGIGKGIQRITKALEELLGDYLTGGFVIAKHGDDVIMEKLEVALAGHPVPDIHCAIGCQKMVDIITAAKFTSNDLVITAIGNGVSSLLTLPWPELSFEDVAETTRLMQIEYGIKTMELNEIRVSIDQLKGGRISRMIHPAKMVHLFGVGTTPPGGKEKNPEPTDYENLIKHNDWLHTISVNMTAEKALGVIKKWDVEGKMPESIVRFLTDMDPAKDAVRWEEFLTYDFRMFGVMTRKRSTSQAAMDKARELGYTPYFIGSIGTEAAPSGRYTARLAIAAEAANSMSPFKPPCALFTTGELLVTCGDNPGVGGRNQEFCLAAATDIHLHKRIVMGAADTDGTDGPGGQFHPDATAKGVTVLAGAIVDGYTYAACVEKDVDVHHALATHATSRALWEVGSGMSATQNISVGDISCTLVMDHDG